MEDPGLPGTMPLSGYWKATGPNKFIGRGTQVADVCKGFSTGIFQKFRKKIRKCWKNAFVKSSTKIGNLCTPTYKFIWPGCLPVASCKTLNNNNNNGKIHLENPLQKSATCVPLPINLFGPVAFQ